MSITAPIMSVGGIVMALREDLGLSIVLVICVPLLAGTVGLIIGRMVPLFRAMQPKLDALNRVLREQITGMRVVRAFVREATEAERFEVAARTPCAAAARIPTPAARPLVAGIR